MNTIGLIISIAVEIINEITLPPLKSKEFVKILKILTMIARIFTITKVIITANHASLSPRAVLCKIKIATIGIATDLNITPNIDVYL